MTRYSLPGTRESVPDPPAFVDPRNPILTWLLGGVAFLSLENTRSGEFRVYKVVRSRRSHERAWSWFVRERVRPEGKDPDATAFVEQPFEAWLYLGEIRTGLEGGPSMQSSPWVQPTQATTPEGDRRTGAFDWLLDKLAQGWTGEPTDQIHAHLYRSTRCIRCRNRLTTPESIAKGIGPECEKKETETRS